MHVMSTEKYLSTQSYLNDSTTSSGFDESLTSRPPPTAMNMSFFLNFFDELAEVETDEVVKFMKSWYGPLLQISTVFPSWKRSMILISLAVLLLHTIMLSAYILILLYTSWLLLREKDYPLVSLCLHYTMLLFYGLVCLFWLNKDRILNGVIHARFIEDVATYRSGRIYSEEKCVKIEKQIARETLQFLLLPGVILLVAAMVFAVPYLSKWLRGMKEPYTANGINLNLPIAAWYPISTHTGFLHFLAVSHQLLAAACLAIIIVTVFVILLRFSQKVRYELKVLHYSLESLFERSEKIYLKMYPEKISTEVKWSDPIYQRVVSLCLKDSVIHHHKIIEIMDIYQTMVSIPVAMAYAIGTGAIGLSLVSIIHALKVGNYENMVIFSLFCLDEVVNMFTVSLIGESITNETLILRDRLYDMNWYKLDSHNRKTMLNFQTAITEPMVVKAAGLVDLSMDTFSSIMNSAYSFFNLVNAQ